MRAYRNTGTLFGNSSKPSKSGTYASAAPALNRKTVRFCVGYVHRHWGTYGMHMLVSCRTTSLSDGGKDDDSRTVHRPCPNLDLKSESVPNVRCNGASSSRELEGPELQVRQEKRGGRTSSRVVIVSGVVQSLDESRVGILGGRPQGYP